MLPARPRRLPWAHRRSLPGPRTSRTSSAAGKEHVRARGWFCLPQAPENVSCRPGACSPRLSGGVSGSLCCTKLPAGAGLQRLRPRSDPLLPALSRPGNARWLVCVGSCSGKGQRAAGSASCLPSAPRGSAAGAGHGYFRRCHPGCNLGCLLTATSSPSSHSSAFLFPPPFPSHQKIVPVVLNFSL